MDTRMIRLGLFTLAAVLLLPCVSSAQQKKRKNKPGQYKRVHQHALALITSGKVEQAIEKLEKFAAKYPKDAETPFMLSVALAQSGDVEAATEAMGRAIKLGLPAGRFLAGPRDLLKPIHKTRAYRELLAEYAGQPVHGPMLGDLRSDGMSVWVRAAMPSQVDVLVYVIEGKAAKWATIGSAKASEASDLVAKVRLSGLKPDTKYGYEIQIHNDGADGNTTRKFALLKSADNLHLFRTAPAVGTKKSFRLVFGGGSGFVPENERAWTRIEKQDPTFLLLLGDNTYSDAPKSSHMQRYCYYRRQSRPEYRRLIASRAVYSIWDDHDFGTNDCIGGPEIDSPSWKQPVWNVFRENWINPSYGGGKQQPGVWYDFMYGDVHFIMLDGRYYRTDQKAEVPSMLGPVQKAWLKRTLAGSKATFKVICSPVPWEYRAKGKSRDTWNGFRQERAEIFSHLSANQIEGVLLMSADRHRSDAWRIERADDYDLYEFNSSRLTNQHVHATMKEAIFSYNAKQSFGVVTFDMTATDPTVTYDVVSIDGEKVHSLNVKRSQLER